MNFSYRFVPGGLPAELAVLEAEEVVDHLRNHLGNFLLDPTVCTVYLNRLLSAVTRQENTSARVRSLTAYLINRWIEMSPLNIMAVRLAEASGLRVPHRNDILRCALPPHEASKLAPILSAASPKDTRSGLIALLRSYPFSVEAIEPLLRIELDLGIPVGSEWLDMIRLPDSLKPLLRQSLFLHCLMQRDMERAAEFFSELDLTHAGPYVLNHAAEFFAAKGFTERAVQTYEQSYRLDPAQIPVRFRTEALADGIHSRKGDLGRPIAVCLYSYNKEALLDKTLQCLAGSNLGNAHIFVLLNGCTDKSRERVEALRNRLFGPRLTVVSLPVNIGAPAARNWLLSLPQVNSSPYVAFLDDDVEVPPTWLESLVGVLEQHPKAGVAGVKVLNPGKPPRLQYLYRNVAVARSDLVRISLDVPNWNYDVGFYDFTRNTAHVMGCCHVFRREALDAVRHFDIRFSPSQMDDIAHDLELALAGYEVIFHGLVACIHHQMSGIGIAVKRVDFARLGNGVGNDVKFSYLFADRLDKIRGLNNLRLVPDGAIQTSWTGPAEGRP